MFQAKTFGWPSPRRWSPWRPWRPARPGCWAGFVVSFFCPSLLVCDHCMHAPAGCQAPCDEGPHEGNESIPFILNASIHQSLWHLGFTRECHWRSQLARPRARTGASIVAHFMCCWISILVHCVAFHGFHAGSARATTGSQGQCPTGFHHLFLNLQMTGIAGHSGRPTPCHQVHGMQGHLGVGLETLAQPGVPELWGPWASSIPKGIHWRVWEPMMATRAEMLVWKKVPFECVCTMLSTLVLHAMFSMCMSFHMVSTQCFMQLCPCLPACLVCHVMLPKCLHCAYCQHQVLHDLACMISCMWLISNVLIFFYIFDFSLDLCVIQNMMLNHI